MEGMVYLKMIILSCGLENLENYECIWADRIAISPSVVMRSLDNFLGKFREELHTMAWQAYAAKEDIYQIIISIDNENVKTFGFWTDIYSEISHDDFKKIDDDIWKVVNSFINAARPCIACKIMESEKFQRQ